MDHDYQIEIQIVNGKAFFSNHESNLIINRIFVRYILPIKMSFLSKKQVTLQTIMYAPQHNSRFKSYIK